MEIVFFLIVILLYALMHMIKPPYGVLFHADTGEYVDSAVVVLYDAVSGAELARSVTDMHGRYSFFVQPGQYRIQVERTHFSALFEYNPFHVLYGAPYTGGIIKRTKESAISVPIALHQDAPDWNHEEKIKRKLQIAGYRVWLRRVVLFIAAATALVTLICAIAWSLPVIYTTLALLMMLWWVFFLFHYAPVPGRVHWAQQGRQDGYIEVVGFGDTVIRRIPLSPTAHYWALIPPGVYDLRVYEYLDSDAHANLIEYSHSGRPSRLVQMYSRVDCHDGIIDKILFM